jgi:UDP-glucose 4-epimerase
VIGPILITGSEGFIGSALLEEINALFPNVEISTIDLLPKSKSKVLSLNNHFEIDLCNSTQVFKAFSILKPRTVIHLAAQTDVRSSLTNPEADYRSNVIATQNVIDSCKEFGVRQLIYANSGGAIFGDLQDLIPANENSKFAPLSPYGVHKLEAMRRVVLMKTENPLCNFLVLNLANVYGFTKPPKGVIPTFIDKGLRNEKIEVYGSGDSVRDYVHVDDVISAILRSLEFNQSDIFNIATGEGTSIKELISILNIVLPKKLSITNSSKVSGEVEYSVLDNYKAEKILGWTPNVNLEKGISLLVEKYRSSIDYR